jgi:HD-GYP domain-containing protein (c-di-GMP phosphodiesterase class II)
MISSKDSSELLHHLNRIGIALSCEKDLDRLLDLILREARIFARADAGSLFLKQGGGLIFIAAQNETLDSRGGEQKSDYYGSSVKLNNESIAGHVAVTGKVLNIPDAYHLPSEVPYRFLKKFDEENHYRTCSVLAVPMNIPNGEVIGVLQLINAMNEQKETVPFPEMFEELMLSLASQAAVAIRNAMLLEEIKQAHLDTIFRLSKAAEYRDEDTEAHLRRVTGYTIVVAKKLGLQTKEIDFLRYAAPMHDIGKLGVPDAVLLKPGKLTPEEFELMKKHTLIGAKILEGSDQKLFQIAKEIAISHHEKFNGTGYPYGLKGEAIPFYGRIVALPDVFDALTSKRVYKPAFSVAQAVDMIREESGKHFDPVVVKAFIDSLDEIVQVKEKEQT